MSESQLQDSTRLMINLELLAQISAGPMLIDPSALRACLAAAAALPVNAKDCQDEMPRGMMMSGSVAIIPIQGLIMPTGSWISKILGWSNLEDITQAVNQCAGDSRVKTVLFDCNSPGGAADGITECADAIFALRATKKTVAVSRYTMASACYWLGAAAQTVVAAPLSTTGSIGCWTMHLEESKAMEEAGLKATIIRAGKYKIEANPFEPLTEEARNFIQSQVDATYSAFVGAVARYRGTSPGQVRAGYGQGRCLMDADAKAAGLVDAILPASTLGSRLAAGTRIALGEGLEIEAADWCALGLGTLEVPEPQPKEAHCWEVDADYLQLLARGAAA